MAARLDGLATEERAVVQDASVLGKTFTKPGLTALTGVSEDELEPLLASLVRKEVLSIQADPRSPERGQYAFLQDIVKRVAYETISRRERRAKHLAAAEFLSSAWSGEEDEIAEVVAAHYLDAYRAAPDAPGADEIREKARQMLVRSAERAASLAANAEAQRSFERAVELTDDPLVRAELHERAGMMARIGARPEATAHFERSIELFEAVGATHAAARVSARLAEVMWDRGRLEEGLQVMDRSLEVLALEEPDEDLAALAAQLGRFKFFADETDLAAQRIETALDIAEALSLPEILSQALNTKAIVLNARGRIKEGLALLRYALEVALEHDKPSAALRAYYNLTDLLQHADRYEEAEKCLRDALTLARRVGNRYWEWSLLGQTYSLFSLGRWDDALTMAAELPEERWSEARGAFSGKLFVGVAVNVHRGSLQEAERIVSLFAEMEASADVQERAIHACGKSTLLLAQGEAGEAYRVADAGFAARDAIGITAEAAKESFVVAVQAALDSGNLEQAEALLAVVEELPPGHVSWFYRAQLPRLTARLAARKGESESAERRFKDATGRFREMGMPFYLAVTQLEHGEWLTLQGRNDEAEALLAEPRRTFEQLQASPWLERAARASRASQQPEVVT